MNKPFLTSPKLLKGDLRTDRLTLIEDMLIINSINMDNQIMITQKLLNFLEVVKKHTSIEERLVSINKNINRPKVTSTKP